MPDLSTTDDRPLEIPRPVTSWVLYDSDRDPRLKKTPVPVAASPRHGDRPAAAVPFAGGVAAAAGAIRSPAPSGRWCSRHGVMGMGRGCVFCAHPEDLDESIEVGDQVRAGMAVYEVVRGPGGRLVLEGPLNRVADGGLL